MNLNGTVKPALANVITALRGATEWAGVLAYNEFAHFTVLQKPALWAKAEVELPAEWTPNDDTLTTEWLHHQGIFVSVDVTGQAVEAVARERPFHPVRTYLKVVRGAKQRNWDTGTPRMTSESCFQLSTGLQTLGNRPGEACAKALHHAAWRTQTGDLAGASQLPESASAAQLAGVPGVVATWAQVQRAALSVAIVGPPRPLSAAGGLVAQSL